MLALLIVDGYRCTFASLFDLCSVFCTSALLLVTGLQCYSACQQARVMRKFFSKTQSNGVQALNGKPVGKHFFSARCAG